jgi:DNA invertase Pin-like site-specific DNA recombinase
MLYKYKRRIHTIQQQLKNINNGDDKTKLNRDEIVAFIKNELSTASLKSIVYHFDTNNSMVYSLLSPDKPGDIIQQLRYEKVKELRSLGKSAKEIAQVTGLSDSYVRKIWNNPS